MKKMDFKLMVAAIGLSSMVACSNQSANTASKTQDATTENNQVDIKNNKAMTYSKKYTNADFYKDGKFQQDVAMEAMKDMFAFYGVPFTELMAKDMWVTDFGLGDFENVGMGGIFWVNDPEYGYFAHAIYLLPGQMIPEHAHDSPSLNVPHTARLLITDTTRVLLDSTSGGVPSCHTIPSAPVTGYVVVPTVM